MVVRVDPDHVVSTSVGWSSAALRSSGVAAGHAVGVGRRTSAARLAIHPTSSEGLRGPTVDVRCGESLATPADGAR